MAVPLVQITGTKTKTLNELTSSMTLDIPSQTVYLDSQNSGTARTVTIYAKGSTNIGLRFNSSSSAWEFSNNGSVYISTKQFSDAGEPTGFVDRTATLSWNDATREITITGNHTIYVNGVPYDKTTATKAIANTTGTHFIYYDASGTLTESTSFPGFFVPYMASVYWNSSTSKGIVGEERHGITMDGQTHNYLHSTVGTRFESGLTLTVPTNSTFSVASGIIWDEDIKLSISTATACDVLYKNGTADYQWDANQAALYGTSLRYNNGNTLTSTTNGYFSALWVFASNSIARPIIVVIGQREDNTLANARLNNTYDSLSLGSLPLKEMKLIYRVLYQNNGGTATYQELSDYRTVSNLPSGTYVATSHSTLTGLTAPADDHTQYALLAGRTGGQTFTGLNEAQPVLTISKTAAQSGDLLTISAGASATGNSLKINQSGNADAINVVLDSSTAAQALVVTESVACTTSMVQLTRSQGSGDTINLSRNPGSSTGGRSIYILHGASATGNCIEILNSSAGGSVLASTIGASARGISIADDTGNPANPYAMVAISRGSNAATGPCLTITNYSNVRAIETTLMHTGAVALFCTDSTTACTNAMAFFQRNSNASGAAIQISNSGSGNGITVSHSGVGDAINIAVSTSTATQALVVTDSTLAATNPLIQVTRNGNATGDVFSISNNGTGDAIGVSLGGTSSQALVISDSTVACSQPAIYMNRNLNATASIVKLENSGTAHCIELLNAGTGHCIDATISQASSQVLVGRDFSTTTYVNAMVDLTRNSNSSGHLIQATNAGSGSGMYVYQSGTGDAFKVDLWHTSSQALVVTDQASCTSAMVHLARGSGSTASALYISNYGSGNGAEIGAYSNAVALRIDRNPSTSGTLLDILNSSTTNNQPLVSITETIDGPTGALLRLYKVPPTTSTGGNAFSITMGANATGAAIGIVHSNASANAISLSNGSTTTATLSQGGVLTITRGVISGQSSTLGDIKFAARTADPSSPVEGDLWFHTTDNVFKYYDGATTRTLATATYVTLDNAYDNGYGITIDSNPVTLTNTSSNNSLNISGTSTGYGIYLLNPTHTSTNPQGFSAPEIVFSAYGIETGGVEHLSQSKFLFQDISSDGVASKLSWLFRTDTGSWTNGFVVIAAGSASYTQFYGTVRANRFETVDGFYSYSGTTAPSLTVVNQAASSYDALVIEQAGSGDIISAGDGTDEFLVLSNAGNLGVGTTAPQEEVTIGSGGTLAIEMAPPGKPSGTPSGLGGSMASGTYYYVITAFDSTGETIPGAESNAVVVVSGPGTGSVALSWTAVTGASAYGVYRTQTSGDYTTGGSHYIGKPTTNSYTDTAAAPSPGVVPTVTTAYSAKLPASDGWFLGGNIGFGTSLPTALLHAKLGDDTSLVGVKIEDSSAISYAQPALSITRTTGTTKPAIYVNNSGDSYGLEVESSGPSPAIRATLKAHTNACGFSVYDNGTTAYAGSLIEAYRLSTTASGKLIDLYNMGTGNGIDIVQVGNGDAFKATLSTGTSAQGLVVADGGSAYSNPAVQVLRSSATASGAAVDVQNSGSGDSIAVLHSGGGDALSVSLGANTSGQAITVIEGSYAYSNPAISVSRTSATATGAAVSVTNNSNGGTGINLAQNGGGDAVAVTLGSNTSGQALVVTEGSYAYSNPAVSISRSSATSTGAAVSLTNSGTGNGVTLTQNGGGDAVGITLGANTSGQAIVVTEGSYAYSNPAISVTRNNSATSTGIAVAMGSSTGRGITISGSGSGELLYLSGTPSGSSLSINLGTATSAANGMLITTSAYFEGDAIEIDKSAGAYVTSNNTGIRMTLGGGDCRGIYISKGGTGQALVIAGTGSTTANQPTVSITHNANANADTMLFVEKTTGMLSSITDGMVKIRAGSQIYGELLKLDHSGYTVDSSSNWITGYSNSVKHFGWHASGALGIGMFNDTDTPGKIPQADITLGAGKVLAIELAKPTAPSGTPGSAGSMATGTYYYAISALVGSGETVRGPQSTGISVTGPTGSVALSWTAVTGATSYKVYRTTTSNDFRTSSSYIANPSTNSYTDTAASPSPGTPAWNTTAYGTKLPASDGWFLTGNLGIGTNAPVASLDVSKSGGFGTIAVHTYNTDPTPEFLGYAARGTSSSPSAVQLNDGIVQIAGIGYGATGFPASRRGWINIKAAEAWTDAAQGTYIAFATTATGGTSAGEKVRIRHDGNLGVNVTDPTARLHVVESGTQAGAYVNHSGNASGLAITKSGGSDGIAVSINQSTAYAFAATLDGDGCGGLYLADSASNLRPSNPLLYLSAVSTAVAPPAHFIWNGGSGQLKLERTGTSTGAAMIGADSAGFKVMNSTGATLWTTTDSNGLNLGTTGQGIFFNATATREDGIFYDSSQGATIFRTGNNDTVMRLIRATGMFLIGGGCATMSTAPGEFANFDYGISPVCWNLQHNASNQFSYSGDTSNNGGGAIYANIFGDMHFAVRATSGGGGGTLTDAQFWGLTKMTIQNDGAVGIGTTSPAYKLDVAGDIKLTGAIQNQTSTVNFLNSSSAQGVKVGSLVVSDSYSDSASIPDAYIKGTLGVGMAASQKLSVKHGSGYGEVIGAYSNAADVHVGIACSNDGSGRIGAVSNHNFILFANNTDRVSVGTTTPLTVLQSANSYNNGFCINGGTYSYYMYENGSNTLYTRGSGSFAWTNSTPTTLMSLNTYGGLTTFPTSGYNGFSCTQSSGATGEGYYVSHSGSGDAFQAYHYSSGYGLYVYHSGTVAAAYLYKYGTSGGHNLHIYRSTTGATGGCGIYLDMQSTNYSDPAMQHWYNGTDHVWQAFNNNSSYANSFISVEANRTVANAFNYFRAYNATAGGQTFRLSGDGNGFCDGAWYGGGADYAEFIDTVQAKTEYEAGDVLVIAGEDTYDLSSTPNDSKIAGVYSQKPVIVGNYVEDDTKETGGTLETASWNVEEKSQRYRRLKISGDVTASYVAGEWIRFNLNDDSWKRGFEVKSSIYDSQNDVTWVDTDVNSLTPIGSTTHKLYNNVPVKDHILLAMLGRTMTKCVTENGSIVPGDLLVTSSTVGHAMKAPATPANGTILGKALGTLTDDGSGTVTGSIRAYINLA